MGDSKTISELVEECEAFEQCPNCGRYLARTSNHRCGTEESSGNQPNRAERDRRARADTRGDDTLVGVFDWKGSNTYAYHDFTNGQPRCGCHHHADTEELTAVTLDRAKERGLSPCGSCRQLR